MVEQKRVVILGGHGKIALLAAPKLVDAGYAVESVIRNPDQTEDINATGATAVHLDMENASQEELAEAFSGAEAVVFSAGAGGGNPDRTRAVDRDAAIRSMDAAADAGVTRYIMVSYARSEVDIHTLDPSESFYPYAAAKHHADEHLRSTNLDYTILGPGKLTGNSVTKKIRVVTAEEAAQLATGESDAAETSRENVAEVITYVVSHPVSVKQTVNFFDGETDLGQALQ